MDTLGPFRRTIRNAGLEKVVVALVGHSAHIARHWHTPLGMVFIDGGHALATALSDWRGWSGHVRPGGVLAIHDVFHRPSDGGRPPHEIFQFAVQSGLFRCEKRVESLAFLRRLG